MVSGRVQCGQTPRIRRSSHSDDGGLEGEFRDPDLPFYIVELADFLHPSDKGGRAAWAQMRQQQAKAAAMTERAFLIPNSDLGEWNDIHPLDKKTLGKRAADAVLKNKRN